jgi:hypothetical protein
MKKVADRVRKSLRDLKPYYKPTKCYIEDSSSYTMILGNVRFKEVQCKDLAAMFDEGKVTKRVAVCNERKGKCILVDAGAKLLILDLKGNEIYFTVDECDKVSKWTKLGYIITGKGEGRVIKTPRSGYIILINEIFGHKADRFKVYLVVEGNVHESRPEK